MNPNSPVSNAMKQTAKTDAERGEDTSPSENSSPTTEEAVREGDQSVGEADTGGSSPYEEPHHLAKSQRSN